MTALAVGSSATVSLRDAGQVTVSTNGGFASVTVTPTAGSAQTVSIGPGPARHTFGPYKEGATVVMVNSSVGEMDYDRPGGNVATFSDDGRSLVDGAGAVFPIGVPLEGATPLFRWVTGDLGTASAVAVGTPVVTDPVDLDRATDGSVCFVHTGGTLAIAYDVSSDGVRWSLGGTIASGLAAGTYSYLLNTLSRSRFVRFTLTATGSTCNTRGFVQATTAHARMKSRVVQRSAFGDGTVLLSMTSGSTIVSPPIDIRRAVRAESSVRIVVGSGAVKVSAQVSRDGVNNLVSLGDLQTGMTAGNYVVNLSSLTQYGHFVTLTITETAASTATVSGYASLTYADQFAIDGSSRKVAVVAPRLAFDGSSNWSAHGISVMSMYSLMRRMGYDAEILSLDDASTLFDDLALPYEFCVMPHANHGGLWSTWNSGVGKPISKLCKGETAMPFFAVGVTSSNNAVLLANLGAGTRDAEAHRKILWNGNAWYTNCGAYAVTVQSHMGSYATWMTASDGTTPVAWRYSGAKGKVYITCGYNGGTGDQNLFPLAFAEALKNGHVATPPRKIKAVIDIDDMPTNIVGGVQTVADMDRVYAAMQALNMPCSFGLRPEDIVGGRMPADMSSWIAGRVAGSGGLLYPIAHSGNWMWKTGDKAAKHANYIADVATIIGRGITIGTDAAQYNAYGYTYFNNNAFDVGTVDLGQIGPDYTASTGNLTKQAGYGWVVVRADDLNGNNTAGFGEPAEVFGETWYRGVRVVASHNHISSSDRSINFDDAGAGSAKISLQCMRWIRYGLATPTPLYIHGENCYIGHDSGDAPGTRWLELIVGAYKNGLNGVVEFVHGSALVNS
jgi:hypothetical protein